MSTGRIDPSKMASHLARFLMVRHFAERDAERSGAHFLSAVSGWRAGCILLWRRSSTGRRTIMCIINQTPEIHFHQTTTPEQFVAGLTDFGVARAGSELDLLVSNNAQKSS